MFWNKKKDADGVVQTTAGGLKKGHWALRFVGFILMVPVNLIKVLFKKKAKRVEGVAGDAVSEDVENSNAESSVMALPAVLDSKEKTEEGQLEEGGDFQNTEPEPEEKKKMGLFGRIIWTLNIIGVLYFVYFLGFTVPLGPNEGAVRKNILFGISDVAVSGPGRVFRIPWLQSIVPMDCSIRYAEFIPEVKVVLGEYFDEVVPNTGLRMPNKSNTYVQVRLVVPYKPYKEPKYNKDGKLIHGGPYQLNLRTGLKTDRISKNVNNIIETEAIKFFGGLSQDGFYLPDPKNPENNYLHQKNQKLLEKLREIWAPDGIEILDCLLETFYFEDKNIEQKIFEKNLQVVEEELKTARLAQMTKEAELRRVDAEGLARVGAEKQRGLSEANAIEAEANLYFTQKSSLGLTAVNNAIASQTQQREKAVEGVGGERLIKIRKAQVMSNIMSSGIINGNPIEMITKEVK
ncbi:hypothetical protein A2331_05080 [Candidatus Falkowbacteria bacterium RIFOXYB2_FULL_34_18]|uniref:Band 7 domain-containing protein n=1 Tax=Candidatus Falkowbacteria bacterium RIFOXYD2_FULL_34_120 TaxID=1798007 RepID=A0A1F5TMY2_9BACT|nr:MAG: hypothetical protein A2500_07165 [Candidatus Falkowbacteria bacterium RIFOXYC12_FULL_34_55]OGF28719.1 MAG: hypothetical protein A2331_05080 [Candidatus Falkowbacteria bacterium RIFOXYB2_FULL_34_18]OGF38084.1 MAG: hypothetical protein A2466_04260 [Candidatus Falkowbacteria bacterium RIFOXYC2_FULL_34_220]OGF38338.1 MAG: hypothetical protein A2515_06290 [Candidatus Falkowbacteria bacterium RIFOXYD12_FULL_34_57]OGF40325.1 MAG: hypothetical protein A2531_00550 [Candidatus Falkowbacteria bact